VSGAGDVRTVAFHLPQFHPTPENDEWWGPGFTDWINVARAEPRFRGHLQPHEPGELGWYDLRVPEVRAAQAELASAHGIAAFCYYHYWFGGRRLLQRPVDEILRLGEPDFPFLLCWANEPWTRAWDGKTSAVLQPQTYSAADDVAHLQSLAEAFADPRYLRIDGRPVFLVYRAFQLPDPRATTDRWRAEAARLGVGELYLCSMQTGRGERHPPATLGFDAAVQFAPFYGLPPLTPVERASRAAERRIGVTTRPARYRVVDYDALVAEHLAAEPVGYTRYPCVSPGFDNSSRRPERGATIVTGSTPERYGRWLRAAIDGFEPPSPEENLVFVNAWNEWAEGNHLEPDRHWGRAYLHAHAQAIAGATPARAS
jgi:lipopolysaccharide biosynthesis protein